MRWSRRWRRAGCGRCRSSCSSLKDGEAAALLARDLRRAPARGDPERDRVFAGGAGRRRSAAAPIARSCRSSSAGGDEESWRSGTRGLGPRDLAMNVALARDRRPHPVARRVVQGAARPRSGDRGRSRRLSAGRRPGRLRRRSRAQLGAAARAGRRPSAGSRSCSPITRTATAGSATASGSIRRHRRSRSCRRLREAGYRTGDVPEDGAALMRAAARRPDQCQTRSAPAEETLSFAEYSAFFASLPHSRAAGGCASAGAPPSATRSSARGGSIAAGSRSPASAPAMSRC